MKILLDNNAIDLVQKHWDNIEPLKEKHNFFISPSCLEELANMPDQKIENRIKNLIYLVELSPTFLLDSVFVFGYSRLGCACFGKCEIYYKILNQSKSNIRDAILADTAYTNECYLLTNDKTLYNKMKSLNLKVITFEELINME